MFDRSGFLEELKRNPALVTRLNTIVNGEVGRNAPLETRVLYLETIFNRAQARGQSLAEVTRSVDGRFNGDGSGRGGYYPSTTFTNGAVRSQNEQNSFNELVLKPVLAGSDVSTQKLGFAATGNASAHVARNGVANGKYTRHATPGGKAGDPGKETYVQEGRLDNIDRLNQFASGGSIPRPPADVPLTEAQFASYQPHTLDIQRAYPGRNYQPPTQVGVEGGAPGERVPLPTARPAQQQQAAAPAQKTVGEAPGRGFLNAMRQAFAPQPGGGLGDAMIAGMGPRGALMSTFTDPTTRQQYLQGGSGEEAMGVLRPIGQAAARAAPAPQRPAPTSPPDQRGAASVNPPREPVPLPMARPVLQDNPFDQSGYAPDRPAGSPDNPFDVPLSPSGVPVAETPLAPFDVKQFMAGNRAPAPTGTALVGPFPRAPEAAGLLAAPAQTASPRQRPSVNPEPAPFSWPTTEVPPVNPPYAPTTTGQQMGGLSPFGTTAPQSGFASMSLLPFEQWPPIGWGWAGPSSFDFGAWG